MRFPARLFSLLLTFAFEQDGFRKSFHGLRPDVSMSWREQLRDHPFFLPRLRRYRCRHRCLHRISVLLFSRRLGRDLSDPRNGGAGDQSGLRGTGDDLQRRYVHRHPGIHLPRHHHPARSVYRLEHQLQPLLPQCRHHQHPGSVEHADVHLRDARQHQRPVQQLTGVFQQAGAVRLSDSSSASTTARTIRKATRSCIN